MPALNNRLSGDYSSRDIDSVSILSFNNSDQQNKKGMAGLISQMRTRAAAPLDQNKQVTKFAKMKKDIAEADGEYRRGILVLETWRKKQYKATEEVNKVSQFSAKIYNSNMLNVHYDEAIESYHKEKNGYCQNFLEKHTSF
jgi:hypothetical protein